MIFIQIIWQTKSAEIWQSLGRHKYLSKILPTRKRALFLFKYLDNLNFNQVIKNHCANENFLRVKAIFKAASENKRSLIRYLLTRQTLIPYSM